MILVVFMCICKIMPIINTKTSHKRLSQDNFVSSILSIVKVFDCLFVFFIHVF